MARNTFGGTTDDSVYSTFSFAGRQLLAVASTPVTFWSAATGGNQYGDLLIGGVAAASVSTVNGQIPEFQGPDNVATMWADAGAARVKIIAAGAVPFGGGEAPTLSNSDVAGFVQSGETHDAVLAQIIAAALPRFQPQTSYTAGDLVVSPDGYIAVAKANFTSVASFDVNDWTVRTGTGGGTTSSGLKAPTTDLGDWTLLRRDTSDVSTGVAWTTAQAIVARALGYTVVTDPQYAGAATLTGGTVDCLAAVNAAQAAVPSSGGILWFPPGKFGFSADVAPKSTSNWRGAGKRLTTLVPLSGSTATKLINLSGKTGVTIEHLGVDANGNTACLSGIYASTQGNVKNITVQHCLVNGFAPGSLSNLYAGVYFWTANRVKIDNVEVTECGRGILIDVGTNTDPADFEVTNCRVTAAYDPASTLATAGYTTMASGIYVRCNSGFKEPVHAKVSHNYVSGAFNDPQLYGGQGVSGAEGHGIVIFRVRYVPVTHNELVGNGRGVLMSSETHGGTVQSNQIDKSWDSGVRAEPESSTGDLTLGTTGGPRGVGILDNTIRNSGPFGFLSGQVPGYYGKGVEMAQAAGSVADGNKIYFTAWHAINADSEACRILNNLIVNPWTGALTDPNQAFISVYGAAAKDCVVDGNVGVDDRATKNTKYGLALTATGANAASLTHFVGINSFKGYTVAAINNPNKALSQWSGAWNDTHLIMGSNHLWFDATGVPRVKASAPTSDTDGTSLTGGTGGTSGGTTAAPAYAGTRTRSYDPISSVYATTGQRRLFRAATNAGLMASSALVPMTFLGDSLTLGYNGSPGVGDPVTKLRNLLIAQGYPVTGGWVFTGNGSNQSDARWAFTGTWQAKSTTTQNYIYSTATGSTATFTSDLPGTIVEFVMFNLTTNNITYSIDGGAPVTQSIASGAKRVIQVTGLANTTHTLTITTTNATTMSLACARVRQATGLSLTNAAIYGSYASDWLPSALSGVYYNPFNLSTGLDTQKQIFVSLGANEAITAGKAPSDVSTALNTILAAGKALTGTPNVVLRGYPAITDSSVATPNPSYPTWGAWVSAMYDAADTSDVAFWDHTDALPTSAQLSTAGLRSDTVHLNAAGYAVLARRELALLTAA